MDTNFSATAPVVKRRDWTAAQLQQELDHARHEVRLIDTFMAADPKPSEEDQELYRERMLFLCEAIRDLPAAITWAKRQEKQKKTGFSSLKVAFDG